MEAAGVERFFHSSGELLGWHGRTTIEVHGKAGGKVEQTRAIYGTLFLQQLSLEGANTIGQDKSEVRRTSEETNRMVIGEDRNVICARRACEQLR